MKPLFHLFQHKNTTAPLILLGAVDFRGQKPGIILASEEDFKRWLRSKRGSELRCQGCYDRRTGNVFLIDGEAKPETVAHELGWHTVFCWAKNNHRGLYDRLVEYAREAPEGIVESVKSKYAGRALSPETLLDEVGAERFTREDISPLLEEAERRVAEGWFDDVENVQDEARRAFVDKIGNKELTKTDIDRIASLEPKKAVEALVLAMISGKSLGGKTLKQIAQEVMDESLEEHDEKYHPEGYREGDTCNKRANQAKSDEADAGVAGNESASEALSEEDAAYLDAVRRGDMTACERMVREAAERAGYSADVGYRISHHAPTNDGYNASLVDVEPMFGTSNRSDLLRMGYGRATAYDAVNAIMNAKGNPDAMIEVYRAVPKSVKDVNLRRGDWVSLSESYARQHGEAWLDSKYKIVKGKVPAKHLFTDGNMLEEAGFDDGQDRAYKNTKNGTKLLGVTYDDSGNVIPLSKRFDMRNPDIRY